MGRAAPSGAEAKGDHKGRPYGWVGWCSPEGRGEKRACRGGFVVCVLGWGGLS